MEAILTSTKLDSLIAQAHLANPTADSTGNPVRSASRIIKNHKVTVRLNGFNVENVQLIVESSAGHITVL